MDTTERPAVATLTADEARGDHVPALRRLAGEFSYAHEWRATPDGTQVYFDPSRDKTLQQGLEYIEIYNKHQVLPHWFARFGIGVGEEPNRWHKNQQCAHKIHPVVIKMLREYAPTDLQQLVAEWPHIAIKDPTQLAYTRNNADGVIDRQLTVRIGKYLARHWPHVPEHERRDAQASHVTDECVILTTLPEMIEALELGPQSCMTSASAYCEHAFKQNEHSKFVAWCKDKTQPEPDWSAHPYNIYDPKLGWGLAVRRSKNGDVSGRALVYGLTVDSFNAVGKAYVRTYVRRADEYAQSSDDQMLQQFLDQQGFKHRGHWPDGTEFAKATYDRRLLMPYMDGATRFRDNGGLWVADDEGRYEGDRGTGGWFQGSDDEEDEPESIGYCTQCESTVYEGGDYIWACRDEDSLVCDGCTDDFTLVRGRHTWGNYREYYVQTDDAVGVDGHYYDIENLPDTVVQRVDGDFALKADCVEIDGDWYGEDDPDVVQLHDDDESGETHGLMGDCWQDANDAWWSADQNCTALDDGRRYMTPEGTPDNLIVRTLCERYGPDEARDLEIIRDFGEQLAERPPVPVPAYVPVVEGSEVVGPPRPSAYTVQDMADHILAEIESRSGWTWAPAITEEQTTSI